MCSSCRVVVAVVDRQTQRVGGSGRQVKVRGGTLVNTAIVILQLMLSSSMVFSIYAHAFIVTSQEIELKIIEQVHAKTQL